MVLIDPILGVFQLNYTVTESVKSVTSRFFAYIWGKGGVHILVIWYGNTLLFFRNLIISFKITLHVAGSYI